MQFVQFGANRLGILSKTGKDIIDFTAELDQEEPDPLFAYLNGNRNATDYIDREPDTSINDVSLAAPLSRPGKIVAMVFNYANHSEEMEDIDTDTGYLLKAPSSIIGPEGTIELPFVGQEYYYEVELAYVIGENIKNGSTPDADSAVFGFTMLLDITMSGEQHMSIRKSYDTFTVLGPSVVTADEIPNPGRLDLTLSINGDTKQQGNTSNMIYNCQEVLRIASRGMTLEVGDIVTTGTPSGVGTFGDGDVITASIEGIGSMTLQAEAQKRRYDDEDVPL